MTLHVQPSLPPSPWPCFDAEEWADWQEANGWLTAYSQRAPIPCFDCPKGWRLEQHERGLCRGLAIYIRGTSGIFHRVGHGQGACVDMAELEQAEPEQLCPSCFPRSAA